MKLPVRNILIAVDALRVLDGGQQKIIKEAGEEKAVIEPFKFSEAMRWWRASTFVKLNDVVVLFEKERQKVFKELSEGGLEIPSEKRREYSERINEILDQEEEISVKKIKRSDLALGTNDIPSEAIAALFHFVDLEDDSE